MKCNLQYIFDKITRSSSAPEAWGQLDRAALIELATAIGAADRGVAINADQGKLLADTILAARAGDHTDLRRLRAVLSSAVQVPVDASEPRPPTRVSVTEVPENSC